MGIFSKKATATDVDRAYESMESTGLVLVGSRYEVWMSNYEQHLPALRSVLKNRAEVIVPVVARIDTQAQYPDSIGVYCGRLQVGWVLKQHAEPIVELLKSDGRPGLGILGELILTKGTRNEQVILHELVVYL